MTNHNYSSEEQLCNAMLHLVLQLSCMIVEFKYAQIQHSQSQMSSAMKRFEDALANFPDCAEGYALYAQVCRRR